MGAINQPYSYNSRVARELKMFTEMITGVYEQYDELIWSRLSESEIGFYYKDKKSKCEVFFGIWYDLWEQYEIPLSIIFEYYGQAPIQWHDRLRKHIEAKNIRGLRVEKYHDFTCILFEYNYFEFDSGDDILRLKTLYKVLRDYASSLSTV